MGLRSYFRGICFRVVSGMKKLIYHSYVLLIAALACAGLSGCETSGTAAPGTTAAAAAPGAAQLIIRRSPNMGTGLFLDVSIDGASVATLPMGETYRGTLSPGQHVISVLLTPNQLNLPRTKKTLTVVKGQTYDFTAMWQGQTVVLR